MQDQSELTINLNNFSKENLQSALILAIECVYSGEGVMPSYYNTGCVINERGAFCLKYFESVVKKSIKT